MPHSIAVDLADLLPAEIAVLDPDGLVVRHNRKWDETARNGGLAHNPAGWNYFAECKAAIARGNRDAPRVLAGLKRVIAGEAATYFATYFCPYAGRHHWYQVASTPYDFHGLRHIVVMHVDVSSLQIDTLTGLSNRAMFEAQLALNLDTAHATGRQTGIVFADINHLKAINDTHGHLAGDEAVKTLGRTLVAIAGPEAVVTRLGGDEFGIVVPVDDEVRLAPDLRAALTHGVECAIELGHGPLSVSASLGAAYFPRDGTTARTLLTAADRAMYSQKRRGT